MRVIILGLLLGLTPVLAFADSKPSSEEVKRVMEFYYHGKGLGPVLLESKICRDIQRVGDEKNECAGDISSEAIKRGEMMYLWMAYMVPLGEEPQTIIVQFDNGGVTRIVKNLQISGQLRNRTWLKVSFDKVGPWKIKVVHDTGSNTVPLGMLDVTVE